PRLKLVAVASSRRDAVLGRYPDIALHESAAAVIADPSVDLVVVATPDATHVELARTALRAGKHVVVEKPMAMSATEGAALVVLARERNRLLTVFHNRRWDGDFKTVRKVNDSGRLGDIKFAALCWDRYRPEMRSGWREQSQDPW